MEVVKFRVWDTEEQKMIYDAQNTYDYGCAGVQIMETHFGDVCLNSRYIKMMQIDLKDKAKKAIYEKDIVKCEESIGIIKFKNARFYIDWKFNKNFWADDLAANAEYCDIIGNIYEIPELLTK